MNTPRYYIETITVGPLEENCYILADAASKDAFIIDPGAEPRRIEEVIEKGGYIPRGIINTHGHWDHIGGNRALKQRYGVPLYIHSREADYLTEPSLNCSAYLGKDCMSPAADVLLEDGQVISLGALSIRVIDTPGHTAGGMCLVVEDAAFTGDSLFCGTMGRTDLPGGDEETLLTSLKKLKGLPGTTKIYPGHGPSCIMAKELQHNEFLQG